MGERQSADGGRQPDLSVPIWVWTVLGFVAVVAVMAVILIRGGGSGDAPGTPADEPAQTRPMAP